MGDSAVVDYRNQNIIRKMGIAALTKELGPVGMAYFIRQFDRGEGNYTVERDQILSDVTVEDIERSIG